MAPDPSGSSSISSSTSREAAVIAPERGDVREKEMRHEDRLRAAQVRVRRHQRVAGRFGALGERRDQRGDAPLQLRDAPFQIQPQVDRDLLVARASGVQPPAGVADPRDQFALDERVHVLVRGGSDAKNADRSARDRISWSAARMRDASAASARRRVRSASAHARLPVTSSSNSRRSNANDAPNSNSASSGSPSKRPDQRCAIVSAPPPATRRAALRAAVSIGSPQILMKPSAALRSNGPGVVGRELLVVEGKRRLAADHPAAALEQLEAHRAGDAPLHRAHERIDGLARLREPEAVVDEVGVGAGQLVLDALEIAGHDQLLELAVRGVQDDRRRRLVDLARLDADQPVLDHVDPADAVRAGNRLEAFDHFEERHLDAVDATGTPPSNSISM